MRTGYHRVCGMASPDGDGAVETASDCHLVRGGGNPACICIDGAPGSTNDDRSGGRESHLTNQICYRNRMKKCLRMSPCPMNCRKTRARPFTLRGVVPGPGDGRSREKHISSGIEQTVECSAHLEMLAYLFGRVNKSDTRRVIDREARAFWDIEWEHANAQCLDLGVRKTFLENRQTDAL